MREARWWNLSVLQIFFSYPYITCTSATEWSPRKHRPHSLDILVINTYQYTIGLIQEAHSGRICAGWRANAPWATGRCKTKWSPEKRECFKHVITLYISEFNRLCHISQYSDSVEIRYWMVEKQVENYCLFIVVLQFSKCGSELTRINWKHKKNSRNQTHFM